MTDKRRFVWETGDIAIVLSRKTKMINISRPEAFESVRIPVRVHVKSVADVVGEYESQLLRWSFETIRGGMNHIDFRRAHKALIRTIAEDAYLEGMKEGGIDDPELDESDQREVNLWKIEQVGYVDDFASWLDSLEPGAAAQVQATARVALWAESLRGLAGLGKVAALGNPVCRWEFDPSIEDHCTTCAELDGQSHRLSWFLDQNYLPQTPGADMECGGFHCGCRLLNAKTGAVVLPT